MTALEPVNPSMRNTLVRIVKAVRENPRDDVEAMVAAAIASPTTRRPLHAVVTRAPARQQAWFQRNFARVLMKRDLTVAPGSWTVPFAGRKVDVPLEGDVAQRWNFAASVAGHDIEVKALYVRLLSVGAVRVAYDIGTNYGTHSLPLLVHGVRTVSIEPNPLCHAFFIDLCAVNGVTADLRKVALGEEEGTVRLAYPVDETWLGTVSTDVEADLRLGHEMAEIEVPMTTLDEMIARGNPIPDLIKVDTEGHDIGVLRGGRRLLAKHKPLIVFESWRVQERGALRDLLTEAGYRIGLPGTGETLSWDAFMTSSEGNFLGL
jgi:FkbM family methyltransferase